MTTLRALEPLAPLPTPQDAWRAAVAMLRAAREVPFDVSVAESWRSAFVHNIGDARAALDNADEAGQPGSCERLRAEMTSLLALVQGLARVSLKDVVEACERAILLEIAASQRSRGAGAASSPWHSAAL